jgi:hypothetical protein
MSDIPVVIGTEIKRTAAFIDPKARATDVFNRATGKTEEANNVLAEGTTTLSALRKYYGK